MSNKGVVKVTITFPDGRVLSDQSAYAIWNDQDEPAVMAAIRPWKIPEPLRSAIVLVAAAATPR